MIAIADKQLSSGRQTNSRHLVELSLRRVAALLANRAQKRASRSTKHLNAAISAIRTEQLVLQRVQTHIKRIFEVCCAHCAHMCAVGGAQNRDAATCASNMSAAQMKSMKTVTFRPDTPMVSRICDEQVA